MSQKRMSATADFAGREDERSPNLFPGQKCAVCSATSDARENSNLNSKLNSEQWFPISGTRLKCSGGKVQDKLGELLGDLNTGHPDPDLCRICLSILEEIDQLESWTESERIKFRRRRSSREEEEESWTSSVPWSYKEQRQKRKREKKKTKHKPEDEAVVRSLSVSKCIWCIKWIFFNCLFSSSFFQPGIKREKDSSKSCSRWDVICTPNNSLPRNGV